MPGSVRADLGDNATTHYYTTDNDGAPAAATSVVCTITAPDGSTSTPASTTVATGHYRVVKNVDQVGLWKIRWTSSAGSDVQFVDVE